MFLAKKAHTPGRAESAVLNFFAAASTKAMTEGEVPDKTHLHGTTWQVVDGTLLVGRYRRPNGTEEKKDDQERSKIAGFDLVAPPSASACMPACIYICVCVCA